MCVKGMGGLLRDIVSQVDEASNSSRLSQFKSTLSQFKSTLSQSAHTRGPGSSSSIAGAALYSVHAIVRESSSARSCMGSTLPLSLRRMLSLPSALGVNHSPSNT